MNFEERSYSGKIFRPRPDVYFSENEKILIIATPWGLSSSSHRLIKIVLDYYNSARDDLEVTSPFERLLCLSSVANSIRTAALLANDSLYGEENKKEYVAGVELFIGAFEGQELTWLQVGHPCLLLNRFGRNILPLGSHLDIAIDMSHSSQLLPPLPSQLLGIDATCNFTIGSFRMREDDRLLLISRSSLPGVIYSTSDQNRNLEAICKVLVREASDEAFWIGVLNL